MTTVARLIAPVENVLSIGSDKGEARFAQARVGSEGEFLQRKSKVSPLVIPSLLRILRDSTPGKKESKQL